MFPSLWAKGRYHKLHIEANEERSLNCIMASLSQLFDMPLQLERASNWGKNLSSHCCLCAKLWFDYFLFLFIDLSSRCFFSIVTSSKNVQLSKAYRQCLSWLSQRCKKHDCHPTRWLDMTLGMRKAWNSKISVVFHPIFKLPKTSNTLPSYLKSPSKWANFFG